MARGGINKALVQKARDSLIAKAMTPTIDNVRVELGNTGSKSTIHRYLKEIEESDPRPESLQERLSDELTSMVAAMVKRVEEEGQQSFNEAQAEFEARRADIEQGWAQTKSELETLQRHYDTQQVALHTQAEEAQTLQSSLQTELTRNARLAQSCADLELRIGEKDGQISSLEEKHTHARDALEHYRAAVKDQRDQEQRRHEGQLQQVQVELRQLQQTISVKQDELTRLNRDNERLLAESRQAAKALSKQEDAVEQLGLQIQGLQVIAAKADGAKEQLQEQIGALRQENRDTTASAEGAHQRVAELTALVAKLSAENATFKMRLDQPPAAD